MDALWISDDFVLDVDTATLDTTGGFTLEAWVRPAPAERKAHLFPEAAFGGRMARFEPGLHAVVPDGYLPKLGSAQLARGIRVVTFSEPNFGGETTIVDADTFEVTDVSASLPVGSLVVLDVNHVRQSNVVVFEHADYQGRAAVVYLPQGLTTRTAGTDVAGSVWVPPGVVLDLTLHDGSTRSNHGDQPDLKDVAELSGRRDNEIAPDIPPNPTGCVLASSPGGVGLVVETPPFDRRGPRTLRFGGRVLRPDRWYHLALTSEGPEAEAVWLLNGKQVKSERLGKPETAWRLGGGFRGAVAGVAVWGHARTPEVIADERCATRSAADPPVIDLFADGTSAFARDDSSWATTADIPLAPGSTMVAKDLWHEANVAHQAEMEEAKARGGLQKRLARERAQRTQDLAHERARRHILTDGIKHLAFARGNELILSPNGFTTSQLRINDLAIDGSGRVYSAGQSFAGGAQGQGDVLALSATGGHPSLADAADLRVNHLVGDAFGTSWEPEPIEWIQIRHGDLVDEVITNGHKHGQQGGTATKRLELEPGEYIDRVEVHWGIVIKHLKFTTNTGRTTEAGGTEHGHVDTHKGKLLKIGGRNTTWVGPMTIVMEDESGQTRTHNYGGTAEAHEVTSVKPHQYRTIVDGLTVNGHKGQGSGKSGALFLRDGEFISEVVVTHHRAIAFLQVTTNNNRTLGGGTKTGNKEVFEGELHGIGGYVGEQLKIVNQLTFAVEAEPGPPHVDSETSAVPGAIPVALAIDSSHKHPLAANDDDKPWHGLYTIEADGTIRRSWYREGAPTRDSAPLFGGPAPAGRPEYWDVATGHLGDDLYWTNGWEIYRGDVSTTGPGDANIVVPHAVSPFPVAVTVAPNGSLVWLDAEHETVRAMSYDANTRTHGPVRDLYKARRPARGLAVCLLADSRPDSTGEVEFAYWVAADHRTIEVPLLDTPGRYIDLYGNPRQPHGQHAELVPVVEMAGASWTDESGSWTLRFGANEDRVVFDPIRLDPTEGITVVADLVWDGPPTDLGPICVYELATFEDQERIVFAIDADGKPFVHLRWNDEVLEGTSTTRRRARMKPNQSHTITWRIDRRGIATYVDGKLASELAVTWPGGAEVFTAHTLGSANTAQSHRTSPDAVGGEASPKTMFAGFRGAMTRVGAWNTVVPPSDEGFDAYPPIDESWARSLVTIESRHRYLHAGRLDGTEPSVALFRIQMDAGLSMMSNLDAAHAELLTAHAQLAAAKAHKTKLINNAMRAAQEKLAAATQALAEARASAEADIEAARADAAVKKESARRTRAEADANKRAHGL